MGFVIPNHIYTRPHIMCIHGLVLRTSLNWVVAYIERLYIWTDTLLRHEVYPIKRHLIWSLRGLEESPYHHMILHICQPLTLSSIYPAMKAAEVGTKKHLHQTGRFIKRNNNNMTPDEQLTSRYRRSVVDSIFSDILCLWDHWPCNHTTYNHTRQTVDTHQYVWRHHISPHSDKYGYQLVTI